MDYQQHDRDTAALDADHAASDDNADTPVACRLCGGSPVAYAGLCSACLAVDAMPVPVPAPDHTGRMVADALRYTAPGVRVRLQEAIDPRTPNARALGLATEAQALAERSHDVVGLPLSLAVVNLRFALTLSDRVPEATRDRVHRLVTEAWELSVALDEMPETRVSTDELDAWGETEWCVPEGFDAARVAREQGEDAAAGREVA